MRARLEFVKDVLLRDGKQLLLVVLAIGQVLSLVRTLLVSRWLGPELMGKMVPVELIIGGVSAWFAIQGPWQLVRDNGPGGDTYRATLQFVLAIRSAAVILVSSVGLFVLLPDTESGLLGVGLGLVLAGSLAGFEDLEPWKRLRNGDARWLCIAEAARPVAGISIVGLVYAFVGQSLWLPVVTALVAATVRWLVTLQSGAWQYRWRIDGPSIWQICRFSWPLGISGGLHWLSQAGDRIILEASHRGGNGVSIVELGSYATVAGLVMLPLGFLGAAINSVVIPAVSREIRETGHGIQSEARYSARIAMMVVAIVAVGCVAGEWTLRLLLGVQYQSAFFVTSVLVATLGMTVVRHLLFQFAICHGQTRVPMFGNAIRLLVLPAGFFAISSGLGLYGIALAGMLSELLVVIVLAAVVAPRLQVGGVLVGTSVIVSAAALISGALLPVQ